MKDIEKKSRGGSITSFVINNKSIFLFLILAIILAVIQPLFFTPKNLTNLIRQACTSIIMGVGFTMVMASGNLDLSVGKMLGLIGVVSATVSKMGVPLIVTIGCALLLGALCGLLNGVIGTYLKVPMFITTLAMGSVYEGANYLFTNNKAVAQLPDSYIAIGQGYIGPIPMPVVIMLVVVIALWVILNRTKFGRYSLASGGNASAARVAGINVAATTRGVYVLMGLCAAVAALVLTGRAASAQLAAGQGMEMDAIAAVVIGGTPLTGGKGNIIGTVFGCLIITAIGNGMNLMGINSNWQIVAKGLLILIAVVIDLQSSNLLNRRLAAAKQ